MRGLAFGLLALASVCAGCGDPPLCQSEVFIAIQTSQIVTDVDTVAMGVQANVTVRTSLEPNQTAKLQVLDAAGQPMEEVTALVDARGTATFLNVTVPTPRVTLRASADTLCGHGEDTQTIDVTAGAGCDLVLVPPPAANEHYAPLGVLVAGADPDPATPGFQSSLLVQTYPGWTVDLFVAENGGAEVPLGTRVADTDGVAMSADALADGTFAFRATCHSPIGSASSIVTTVLVDTQPPACSFASPAPGSTITPTFDANHDLTDGVQLGIDALVTGGDVEGEPVTVKITPRGGSATTVAGSPVDASGATHAAATLAPPTTPAAFDFVLESRDHAGNTCSATQSYDVVYDGCDISIASPAAPVTSDADGNPGNGSQVDFLLQVSSTCAGRTVTSTCGTDDPSGVVQPDGSLFLRATACSTSPCETSVACTFSVTTAAGVTTTAGTSVTFDDQGPATSLDLVSPALACGVQITPASDIDPNTDGVQILARVTSAGAASKSLEVTNGSGAHSLPTTGDVEVTIEPGINRLVGVGLDTLGNRGQSASCNVTLADLSVSFSPPAADGIIGRADGTVVGSNISFTMCGTVNTTGAAVTIAIDGGAAQPATVTGTTWCRNVTLSESPPAHTIIANATSGASFGTGSLVVRVDLTKPPSALAFIASAVNRQRIHIQWQSPDDGGQPVVAYVLKFSTTTTLTEANFDTTGTVIATSLPAPPGTPESADLFPARLGSPYSIAIATVDAAGNRSVASVVGPVIPSFDRTGAIAAPDVTQGALGLGYAIAHGKFNDDEFEDLAVSAPTQNAGATQKAGAVYVYFGGPSGISATPDLVIAHNAFNAQFGSGLAAVRWTSSTRDDLAIGAPGADTHGHIFVFKGGTLAAGTRTAASADFHITVNATTPGFFATGSLGRSLVESDVDGDGISDLVASVPTGGGTAGGIAILYGGTVTGNVALSDLDASGANGAVVELFRDPAGVAGHQLGFYLHAVGKTEGPNDDTDDIVATYVDDYNTTGDSLFVLRSDGTRPTAAGVVARNFVVGRDVRIDLVQTVYKVTEWGSQVTSIDDQNGDGCRDLVIGAYRIFNDGGEVFVIDGNTVGTAGVASTADPTVTLSAIAGVASSKFGAFVLTHDLSVADIDGDGREDLVVGAVTGGTPKAFVWFGGSIPAGSSSISSAATTLAAPTKFGTFTRQTPKGFAAQARWVGDLDGDGLEDICWAAPFDNVGDGSFEVLSD